jgi:hypothetical protein
MMARRPTRGYANEEMPDAFPGQNLGHIPVVVRLVNDELGEHYRAAEARRWTKTHVMVGVLYVDEADRRNDSLAWLRASDVYRILPGRAVPHSPTNDWDETNDT